jgi:hypothetical protein
MTPRTGGCGRTKRMLDRSARQFNVGAVPNLPLYFLPGFERDFHASYLKPKLFEPTASASKSHIQMRTTSCKR